MPRSLRFQKTNHRKFLVPIIALLLVGVAVPLSVPKGHADDQSTSLTITGLLARRYSDAYLQANSYQNYVDAIQAGNTMTFNVIFTANDYAYQRNITLGVKFDWMSTYQNTSSYTAIYARQTVTISLAYTIPALTGQYANLNQAAHYWTLQAWDMPTTASWHGGCFDNNYNPAYGAVYPMCNSWTNNYYYGQWYPTAIYNTAQATSYTTRLQANAEITALSSAFRTSLTPVPGTSAAIAQYSQAQTEMTLADNAYSTGDFTGAQTHYQNALNDANAAQSSLATIGGGTDTATFTSIWVDSAAILLGGIGAILVGFASFKYLRGKTRGMPTYAPSAPKA